MGEKEDATSAGVSSEDTRDKAREQNFPLNKRNSLIESITDRRENEVAEEVGISKDELEGKEIDKSDDKQDEEKKEDDEKTEEKVDKKVDESGDKLEEEMIAIKVDGEEKSYKKSVVEEHGGVRAFQKELAADKKMREASELKKTYEDKIKNIKPEKSDDLSDGADHSDDGQKKDAGEKPKMDGGTKEKLVDLVHKIQFGDENEAADALFELRDVFGSGNSTQDKAPVVTEKQIDDILNAREIQNRFKTDFAPLYDEKYGKSRLTIMENGKQKIIEVPTLERLTSEEIDRLIADGANPNSYETYQKAGNMVAERFGIQIAKGEETAKKDEDEKPKIGDDVKEKKVIKKKIDNVQGATGSHSDASTVDEGPKTETEMRAQAVQDIKRARGQI